MIQISLKNKGFGILLINLLLLIKTIIGNEIIGCGGFIKSNTDINYKIIQVNKSLLKQSSVKLIIKI